VKVENNLPPGFLLEKHPNGDLGLYAGMSLATIIKNEGKIMHYLKDVFPNDTAPKEIKRRAWEVYMRLKRENNYV
jgi:hypothetical protein